MARVQGDGEGTVKPRNRVCFDEREEMARDFFLLVFYLGGDALGASRITKRTHPKRPKSKRARGLAANAGDLSPWIWFGKDLTADLEQSELNQRFMFGLRC